MNHNRLFTMMAASLLLVTGCSADVVGTYAIASFEKLLSIEGVTLSAAPLLPNTNPEDGWQYISPGGDVFAFSRDFGLSNTPDLVLSLDAEPFLTAGLDPATLPSDRYRYDEEARRLLILGELSNTTFPASAKVTPTDTFRQIVRTAGSAIGYHAQLDHYGIGLGDGNMFEWAKDTATNDKDIVFVLNPAPLIASGLAVDSLQGWIYAPVEAEDENGKMIQIHKLLRPYDLVK